MDTSIFELSNRLSEEEALDQAYDIFLELAPDNLDPADIILFNLQFEERGAAEVVDLTDVWEEHINFDIEPDYFTEVVIGLVNEHDDIDDIFARILICREKENKFCHILWKE